MANRAILGAAMLVAVGVAAWALWPHPTTDRSTKAPPASEKESRHSPVKLVPNKNPEPDRKPPGPSHVEKAQSALKNYSAICEQGDSAKIREASSALFELLRQLPPNDLAELLTSGLGTREANEVLIALENGMRSEDRHQEYEDALLRGLEVVFEQPDKLAALSEKALEYQLSERGREHAARLLMKRGPTDRLASALGRFAAPLQSNVRAEVKQFALEQSLFETTAYLVDDESDVLRLEAALRDPATADRARQALQVARDRSGPQLKERLEQALRH